MADNQQSLLQKILSDHISVELFKGLMAPEKQVMPVNTGVARAYAFHHSAALLRVNVGQMVSRHDNGFNSEKIEFQEYTGKPDGAMIIWRDGHKDNEMWGLYCAISQFYVLQGITEAMAGIDRRSARPESDPVTIQFDSSFYVIESVKQAESPRDPVTDQGEDPQQPEYYVRKLAINGINIDPEDVAPGRGTNTMVSITIRTKEALDQLFEVKALIEKSFASRAMGNA